MAVSRRELQCIECKAKLNPLRAKWLMELVLIPDFGSIKRLRVFDSPWTGD